MIFGKDRPYSSASSCLLFRCISSARLKDRVGVALRGIQRLAPAFDRGFWSCSSSRSERLYRPSANIGPARVADGIGGLGVATAPGYGKPWTAFARQKLTRSGFDERSNHLE